MLVQTLISNLDFTFFLYGLGYMLVATVSFSLHQKDKQLPWKFLGFYGLFLGIVAWMNLLAISFGDTTGLLHLRLLLMSLSYISLFEFGRLGLYHNSKIKLSRLVLIPLIIFALLGLLGGVPVLKITPRYALALPAGVLAALSCFYLARKDKERRIFYYIATVVFILVALSSGLITSPAKWQPAAIFNQENFKNLFGFTIQTVRSILAIFTAFLFAFFYSSLIVKSEIHRQKSPYSNWFIPSIVGLVLISWVISEYIGQYSESNLKKSFLQQTRVTSLALDMYQHANELKLDDHLEFHEELETKLSKIIGVEESVIYIGIHDCIEYSSHDSIIIPLEPVYVLSDTGNVFHAEEVRNYIHKSNSPDKINLFKSGFNYAASVIVPIIDDQSDNHSNPHLFIVRDIKSWLRIISKARLFPITIALVLTILILYYQTFRRVRLESIWKLEDSERRFRLIADNVSDVIWTMDFNLKRIYTSPSVLHMRGITSEEAGQQELEDIVTPGSLNKAKQVLSSLASDALEGRSKPEDFRSIDIEMFKGDGSTIWTQVNVSVVYDTDNKPSYLLGITRDISARKAAEVKLRQSEEKYKDLVEEAGVAILIEDKNEKIVYANDRVKELLGYTPDEVVNLQTQDLIHKDDLRRLRYYHVNTSKGKDVAGKYELRGIKKDKTVVYLEIHAIPLIYNDTYIGNRAYIWDMTERYKAEQELKEKEKQLRQAQKLAKLGNFIYKPAEGEFIWSEQLFSIFERDPEFKPPTVQEFLDFVHQEDQEEIASFKKLNFNKGTTIEMEFRIFTEQGEIKYIYGWGDPVFDESGKFKHIFGTMQDITERKEVEEALVASEKKYKMLIEGQGEGIAITDRDDRFTFVNPAACDLFGLPADELVGMNLSEFLSEQQFFKKEKQNELRKQMIKSSYEIEIRRLDGTVKNILITAAPQLGDEGEWIGSFGVFRDITAIKKAEELNRKIDLRILQQQKMESLGVLAGGVAHDFNNLLQGILGNAELAALDIDETSPAKVCIEDIQEATERAADLTKQILAFSGRGSFIIETIDINELLVDFQQSLSVVVNESDHLGYNFGGQVPLFKGDPEQIRQLLLNMVKNASESINGKKGKIFIETKAEECDREMLDDLFLGEGLPGGEYTVVVIRDNGSGIADDDHQKIYDPFFSTKSLGRGLGLAAVSGILRAHKGAIKMEKSKNAGTEFTVYLPGINIKE